MIELLLEHESIALQDADVVRAALKHFKQHKKLDFADCLVLEVARKAGHSPLGSVDKALGKLKGAVQPGE
jgi:predicted nucleic-acid-binding protein